MIQIVVLQCEKQKPYVVFAYLVFRPCALNTRIYGQINQLQLILSGSPYKRTYFKTLLTPLQQTVKKNISKLISNTSKRQSYISVFRIFSIHNSLVDTQKQHQNSKLASLDTEQMYSYIVNAMQTPPPPFYCLFSNLQMAVKRAPPRIYI